MTHHSLTHRLRLTAAAAFLLCAGAGLAAARAQAAPDQRRSAQTVRSAGSTGSAASAGSTAFSGTPRIGALFSVRNGALDGHFCTASVVHSPHRDLLVTAAHCMVTPGSGKARRDVVFVPGYNSGRSPYGRWAVRSVVVDTHWAAHGDPDYDVAFLTTAPLGRHGRVEDQVGAESLGFDARRGQGLTAVAVGYPWNTERPVHCASRLHDRNGGNGNQLEFDCPGMPSGTSGGPLLTGVDRTGAGPGSVVGVIGGYQTGGYTEDVSYSPYFGPAIAAVYRRAVTQS